MSSTPLPSTLPIPLVPQSVLYFISHHSQHTTILSEMRETRLRDQYASALWDSKITNLATLEECLSNSILVGLDIEFSNTKGNQDVSEAGLAVLRVHEQPPPFLPGLRWYLEENGVETLTIRLRDHGLKPQYEDPKFRFGDKVYADQKDIAHIAARMLSRYDGKRILVGFGMDAEWRWIENDCPSMALLFSAWVDLQELVSQRRKQETLGPEDDIEQPGFTNTIKAMHIADFRGRKRRHLARNDALRCLNRFVWTGYPCSNGASLATYGYKTLSLPGIISSEIVPDSPDQCSRRRQTAALLAQRFVRNVCQVRGYQGCCS
jgi:hypothetical protein